MNIGAVIMEKLLDHLLEIKNKSEKYGLDMEKRLKAPPNDPRCTCFIIIYNKSVLTLELLEYYYNIWKNKFSGLKDNLEKIRKENAERCIEQTKMFFIGVLSAMEFFAKQSVKLYSTTPIGQAINQLEGKKRIYLSIIIMESYKLGLISNDEKYKWERIIWLRNLLIHNNGIAETDDVYTIDRVTFRLHKGIMIKGDLFSFTNLVESAVELYNAWIYKL